MNVVSSLTVIGILLAATPIAPLWADAAAQPTKVAPDPNERVCEDIVVTGSRIAAKRFCGTRAEWKEKQKQDREAIEDAQRHANDPCSAVLTHTGPAAC